ncbi:MAG TPA: LysE family translocator [Usitatibacter sp.]
MLAIHDLPLFLASAVLLNLTPGPDTLFILIQAAKGWRPGMLAALGIGTGCLVHILAATIGLSALLFASATAFALVKGIGACYLIWMGLTLLLARREPALASGAPIDAPDGKKIFVRGALTNALNPKVAMFFLAFLPQFVNSAAPRRTLSFLVLGCLFNLTGTAWNLTLARLASGAVARRPAALKVAAGFSRGVGALFVGLGLKLALAREPP